MEWCDDERGASHAPSASRRGANKANSTAAFGAQTTSPPKPLGKDLLRKLARGSPPASTPTEWIDYEYEFHRRAPTDQARQSEEIEDLECDLDDPSASECGDSGQAAAQSQKRAQNKAGDTEFAMPPKARRHAYT
jgi:hypothetical protein